MKYGQELPVEVEQKLDAYIERIKAIRWFSPDKNIDREKTDKQINVALEAFGVKAGIEYRSIQTNDDWGAARDAALGVLWGAAWDAARGAAMDAARGAARGAAWDAARGAARDAAMGAARGAARGAAWDAARGAAMDAARGAARGAEEVLVSDVDRYTNKYPNGSFVNLIPLWEAGLYPCGVIGGNFVVYVPEQNGEIPQLTGATEVVRNHDLDAMIDEMVRDFTTVRLKTKSEVRGRLLEAIESAVSNREKEIADEVEKMQNEQPALESDDYYDGIKDTKRQVLSIIKRV